MNVEQIKDNVADVVRLLKALSNDRRLIIVCALIEGEKSVGELEVIVGLSQSALSQHLARLRKDQIVSTRRQAQTIFYSLHDKKTQAFMESLCTVFHNTKVVGR
ncbi:MAG: metalloregulator ArsR/SmtB family transcription factor [Alphaproteobacteria bacterium]|nr:metalloregulator ArsR/SmtB family transcription factor [Alphaproteobacteria bacterium]